VGIFFDGPTWACDSLVSSVKKNDVRCVWCNKDNIRLTSSILGMLQIGLAIAGVFGSLIGGSLFIRGCNEAVTSVCPLYTLVHGNIVRTDVRYNACKKSKSRETRDCYDFVVYGAFNTTGGCRAYANSDGPVDWDTIEQYQRRFTVGKQITWYKDKGDRSTCYLTNEVESFWIVGMFFMVCGGVAWALYIVLECAKHWPLPVPPHERLEQIEM
jgi:hypothetical protein